MSTTVHLVQFSTGAGSAEVAHRLVDRHGKDAVTLITADTRVEDGDNWRFAFDVWHWLGQPVWWYLCDGRTPMEVGRDAKCVPNNRMAVCSRVLKRELLRGFIDERYDPHEVIVAEGYDWTEDTRYGAACPLWEPFTLEAPMRDEPLIDKAQVLDAWRARGIKPPRMYEMGFHHGNCGGGCVRAGQSEWRRLFFWHPVRYSEWECEEEQTRAVLGKDVAILKIRSGPREGDPLSLKAFREGLESNPSLFDAADVGVCGCTLPIDPIDTHTRTPSQVWQIGQPGAPTVADLAVNW